MKTSTANKNTQAITLYRAVSDITIAQGNPYWKGDGVFGYGTYFRPEYRPVSSLRAVDDYKKYKIPGELIHWDIFFIYEAKISRILSLNDQNTKGLEMACELSFDDDLSKVLGVKEAHALDLTDLAKKKNFQALDIRGQDVE